MAFRQANIGTRGGTWEDKSLKKSIKGNFFRTRFTKKPPPIKQGALKSSAVIKKNSAVIKKNSPVEKKLPGWKKTPQLKKKLPGRGEEEGKEGEEEGEEGEEEEEEEGDGREVTIWLECSPLW